MPAGGGMGDRDCETTRRKHRMKGSSEKTAFFGEKNEK
jgi:hypothetical protein